MSRSVALWMVVVAGCARTEAAPSDDQAVAERARAALAPFKGSLKQALTAALAVSPESAIEVCANRAPELARAASHDGIVVGRSALKLRNSENAARPWLRPVLAELAAAPSGSDSHRMVTIEGNRRGYAEAIWTAPLCLTCHGESVAPAVDGKLRERYPGDQARGFKAGQFRGVFWVELDATAHARLAPAPRTVTLDEAEARLGEPGVHFYDVNPREMYADQHLPGATWIAYDEVTAAALPPDRDAPLVFYCAIDQCSASHESATRAIELGYHNVFVMPRGILGWKRAGKPTERGFN
jgi:rhodanese-related sulfurtransferase